ncbi:MAG: hypothetical protein KDK50_04355 [Chlamydiia bacterium]|nr:hypothetical protein [Chlamydiia bacterium]
MQARSWKTIGVVIGVFALGSAMGFKTAGTQERVVEAEKIVLKSAHGRTVLEMRVEDHKAVIALCDERGKERLLLEGGDAPGIVVKNRSDKTIAHLRDFKEDGSGFVLCDDKGSKRIQFQGGSAPGVFVLNEDQKVIANMSASKTGYASIAIRSEDEKPQISLKGGTNPTLAFFENDKSQIEMISSTHGPIMKLNNREGAPLVQMQGGTSAGVFLRNQTGEVTGSFVALKSGGSALALANNKGQIASFLRGGDNPSVSFFQNGDAPDVVLGISEKAPHMLMSKSSANEGMLIYGGSPSSVLFINETGQVPVILSKHGLMQDKSAASRGKKSAPKKEKFYSWEEFKNPLEDLESFKR